MEQIDNSQHWHTIIHRFESDLPNEGSLHSVHALCDFLREESKIDSRVRAIEYVRDYMGVSQVQAAFHTKWISLRNMQNLAAFDEREIAALNRLIEMLEETPS